MKSLSALLVVAFSTAALALPAQTASPDTIIVNARIFTGVPAQPWAEALSVKGERIAALGTSAGIRAQTAPTARVIDAGARLVIPGINDAHAHPGAAPPYTSLEGPPAFEQDPALDEILLRLKAAVAKAPAGGWVVGQIGARVLEDPRATRAILDPITGGHPVMLAGWHGHGSLFNTEALRRLKVAEQEPDPAGGFFVRMPDGKTITGVVHEYALFRLRQQFGRLADRERTLESYRRFGREAAALGITSVQVMATAAPIGEVFADVTEANLPIRVRVIDFPMSDPAEWKGPALRQTTGKVTASGTKWILDGTPVERLMFMREPYTDSPSIRGRLNFPIADLRGFLTRALAAGEQPMFHAVGDAAIDALLDELEATGGAKWAPLRPRLEHGDMLEPGHFDRAKRFGVVLVQNPAHFMIAPVMHARLGPRVARAEIVKTTLGAGIPFAIGSDGPMNPFLNIMFAAMNATNPAETLTIEQSLTAYTRGSAYAEFAEQQKGTLAPGMLADLAILSQDIFKVAPQDLPTTTSLLTMVGGRIVHEKQEGK